MKNQPATYGRTRTDWTSEIKPARVAPDIGGNGATRPPSDTGRGGIDADEWAPDAETPVLLDDRSPVPMGTRQDTGEIWPNIENNLSNEVIESPTTMEEVYRGSMKSLLLRNVGNYVVATFLIGTQTTVSWEGILYDVGNDYLAIYQSGRDQYIVSDLYSLKYVEFYDTRRRELCDSLLTAQEPGGNFQRQSGPV